MPFAGGGAFRLTKEEDTLPVWSPDGKQIAFSSKRDGSWQVYVMNADGTNVRRLTTGSANNDYPAWSPDGNYIAFSSTREGRNFDIYVMDAFDGSGVKNITNTPNEDRSTSVGHVDARRAAVFAGSASYRPYGRSSLSVLLLASLASHGVSDGQRCAGVAQATHRHNASSASNSGHPIVGDRRCACHGGGYSCCAYRRRAASASSAPYRRGRRCRTGSSSRVRRGIYLLEAGKRRWITSAEIFARRGLRWDDVRVLTDDALNAIPEGPPLRVGTLVRSTSQEVFLLEGGRQRWIPSAEIFAALGFEWSDVQPIRDVDLAGYPPGPPLYVDSLIVEPAILDALKLLAGNPKLAFIAGLAARASSSREVRASSRGCRGVVPAAHQYDHYQRSVPAHFAGGGWQPRVAHEAMHSIQYWRRPSRPSAA